MTCLLILERQGEGEREKQQVVASRAHPDGKQTHNLGVCPDGELNPQTFSLRDDAPIN